MEMQNILNGVQDVCIANPKKGLVMVLSLRLVSSKPQDSLTLTQEMKLGNDHQHPSDISKTSYSNIKILSYLL